MRWFRAGLLAVGLGLALAGTAAIGATTAQGGESALPGAGATAQPPELPPPLPPAEQPQVEVPAPVPAAQYYVEQAGAASGPFSLDQVKQMIAAGAIRRTTRMWKAGTADWVRAEEIKEVYAALQESAPPELPAKARFEEYMIGEWEAIQQDDYGTSHRFNMRYERDGTFTGIVQMTIPGVPNPAYRTLEGTWSVEAIDDTRFTLTTTTRGGSEMSGTLWILDDDTVRNESGVLSTRSAR